jgi:alpha-glucuronidase
VSDLKRPEWNPVYYARADATGIGFDRTATGSNAIAQYAPHIAAELANPATTPECWLLWFHHVGWDTKMQSGRTLWDEMVAHYDNGVAAVADIQRTWTSLAPYVDHERYDKTATFLTIQRREAQWWRDASIAYFDSISHRNLPPGATVPSHPLAYYEALSFPYAPGH